MRLYIYNGNLLQVSTFACLELSPAAWISAGGKFLSACGNGKSAGGSSLCQLTEEAGRSDMRKDLLQYLHCGHGLHHLRDFRANFVTGYVSMFT